MDERNTRTRGVQDGAAQAVMIAAILIASIIIAMALSARYALSPDQE